MTQAWQQLLGFTRFAQPFWLVVGFAVALLLPVLYLLHDRRQQRLLAAFALERQSDAWGLGVSHVLLWLRRWCVTAAALCGFAALAQPLGAPQLRNVEDRGIDILFAIDTSRSMLTPDVRPDRLTRARLAVEDLLDQLGGDAVGLVAFAGEAFLMAPLTTDHEAFRETLESLDTHTVPLGGTDIAAAIRLGQSTFQSRRDADPVMVLITDGEDLGGEALVAAQAAGKAGIRIYTVGVGTTAGDLIPVPDGTGGEHFVRDADGQLVKSRLDETTLRQIAAATGGTYQPLGAQGQGVTGLYEHTLSRLARHATTGRQVQVYTQLFQWPLGLAVLLLLAEWLVRPVRRHRVPAASVALVLASLVLLFVPAPRANAAAANAQYRSGAQAYRAKDYEAAVKAYRGALDTTDVGLQQNAYYDLGNALYRQGSKPGRDPQQAIQDFKQALSAYDAALQLRSTDADARYNRGVVQKKLDELQRRQQSRNNPQHNQEQKNQRRQSQDQQQNQQGGQQQAGPPGSDQNQSQDQKHSSQGQNPSQNSGPGQDPKKQDQGTNGPQRPQPGQPQPPQSPPQQPDQGQQNQPAAAGVAQAQAGQPHNPGGMTREEAERLLDSVRGQEHHMVTGADSGKPDPRQAKLLRDW